MWRVEAVALARHAPDSHYQPGHQLVSKPPAVLQQLYLRPHGQCAWEAVGKQTMGGCSLGAPTLLAEAAALA